MSSELLNKWSLQAWALEGPPDTLRAPFHALAAEAVDVAPFAKQYWDHGVDAAGNIVRSGLSYLSVESFPSAAHRLR